MKIRIKLYRESITSSPFPVSIAKGMTKKMKNISRVGLRLFETRAKDYLHDKKKAAGLLKQALSKADSNKGSLSQVWEDMQLLFGLIRDWNSGDYKQIPIGSLLMILGAILYFVSPVDFVSDFIPLTGFIDDAAVVAFTVRQIRHDLQEYKNWKSQNPLKSKYIEN